MIILNSCTIKNFIFLAGGVIITRIKKNPEIRREELIDAAFELFCSAGYEKTLIIDIVKKVRVAKGTFYYYFPSKEAILFAIINRYISQMITTFKNEIHHLSALNKLQLFIKNFFLPHQAGIIFEKLKEENQFELISGLWHQTQSIFSPLLMEIIQQGNHEQTMHVIYLNETIPFFWNIFDCLLFSAHSKEDSQILTKKVFIATSALERILGIKEGLLELPIIQQ